MTLRLPTTLATDSDAAAIAALRRYYGRPYLGGDAYVGAHFDSWSSTGDRVGEADRFTADDLVAVTFLSVQVPPTAARAILHTQAEALNALLTGMGPDRAWGGSTIRTRWPRGGLPGTWKRPCGRCRASGHANLPVGGHVRPC